MQMEPAPDVIRRKPLKTVLKSKPKRANFIQPDSDSGESESQPEIIPVKKYLSQKLN